MAAKLNIKSKTDSLLWSFSFSAEVARDFCAPLQAQKSATPNPTNKSLRKS